VDEEAIVRRYVHLKWSVERCARTAHTSPERIKEILSTRDIPIRGQRIAGPVDENAVIRCYLRVGSINVCAKISKIGNDRVRAILRDNGIPLNGPQGPPKPVRPNPV
jgi:hypothetical protein